MNINATILGQSISFVLFVLFCMKYVWSPLMLVLEKRQKEVSDNLAAAKYAKVESERIHAEATEFLNQARVNAQHIIEQAHKSSVYIINEAKCVADQERSRILSQTRMQLESERCCVVDELKKIIGQIVIQSTEKIIEHSMNEVIDQNIIDNFIENACLLREE